MNRVVFALVAILCLLSISSITGLIQVVKAESAPIYINADGSITPSTAPIYSADNITYTLNGNITASADGIVIERNNTILNGAGYTVTGSLNGNGTTLTNISNVTVTNLTITNFTEDIYLDSCSNCTLSGNNVTYNAYGIWLAFCSGCNLSGNNVTANSEIAIYLYSSSGNTLSGNNVANNVDGINLGSSSVNTLFGNNVTRNISNGIYLGSSSNNTIYKNNFANNNNQVYSSNSTNVWDNGSVGNYWSDYNGTDLYSGPYQNVTGSDGIGDTPYVIVANNIDDYPLMGTFQSFNVTNPSSQSIKFEEVDIISNTTIGSVECNIFADDVNSPTRMDWFLTLAGIVGQNDTIGFCRITFPNDLMNYPTYHIATWEQYEYGANVTTDGANCTILDSNNANTTLYFTFNLSDLSRTLNYPDFNLIILPEFPSFLILSLFMMAMLLVVIIYKKKVMPNKRLYQAERALTRS